jgi:putative phosphoribosyl transferase
MLFKSRRQAGKLLTKELQRRKIRPDVVFGLARGGVVVAAEIAQTLRVPLQALVVRKISPPLSPEFAVGAIAALPGAKNSQSFSVWWDQDTIRRLGLSPQWQKRQIIDKKVEVSNYLTQLNFRKFNSRSRRNLRKIVIADDGAATGATMLAAIEAVRKGVSLPESKDTPLLIIVALPAASTDAAAKIKPEADETAILSVDLDFRAVGQYYREFNQVSWDEVKTLLKSNLQS